jgi:hypothetical protein
MVEFQIVRLSILAVPSHSQWPVPVPEPREEVLDSSCELEINKISIDEHARRSEAPPVPIPEPSSELTCPKVELIIIIE